MATSILGVGVVTYMDEAKRVRDKEARQKYGMTWEEVGKQYGRAEQLKLEQTTPAILEAEKRQEEKFSFAPPTVLGQFRNEGQSIEDTYREAVGFAVNRFKRIGDGSQFREDIEDANIVRRRMYGARAKRKEYQDIIAYYNQPLKPDQIAKMNPGDVLRREYYRQMFGVDMYDPDTNEYNFDEAERKEQEFVKKHGQQALDYIEEYSGALWKDKPIELIRLEQARDLLRPYWQIVDRVWSMYPAGLQELSKQIQVMERTDPARAKQMLRRYPALLRARELIARYKAQMRKSNPLIQQAYRLFYGG